MIGPLTLLLGCSMAWAEGRSVDVELQRPTMAPGSLPGIDHPDTERGTLVVGVLGAYLRDPLVLLIEGEETGAVVAQRHTVHLGAAWDISHRVSLRGWLPVAWQWGSEEPGFAADQMGIGDPGLGARLALRSMGPVQTALRADVNLPLGSREAWLGEGAPRLALGVVPAVEGDRLGLHGDVGVLLRAPLDTDTDLSLGSEATLGMAVRGSPWPGVQDLFLGALARWPLMPGEGGQLSSELLMGAILRPDDFISFDLGMGKGLSAGYGTTEFRGWAGMRMTWSGVGQAPLPPPIQVRWVDATPLSDEAPEPAPDPIEWQDGQLAQVRHSRIEIRDPIQFFYDTERIRPESRPTLEAVADILNGSPHLLHVVVEGHASVEGEHDYNYELSIRRSLAVTRALVEAGVHPARLSSRGMGEVLPVTMGTDEASLARSRRVLFLIAEQLDPLDPLPDTGEHLVPWSSTDDAKERAP